MIRPAAGGFLAQTSRAGGCNEIVTSASCEGEGLIVG